MNTTQIAGLVILVTGAIVLAFGFHASEAPMEQLANSFTGHYTDRTMWHLVAGGAAVVGGGLLAIYGRARR
jgi:hypothetical protein